MRQSITWLFVLCLLLTLAQCIRVQVSQMVIDQGLRDSNADGAFAAADLRETVASASGFLPLQLTATVFGVIATFGLDLPERVTALMMLRHVKKEYEVMKEEGKPVTAYFQARKSIVNACVRERTYMVVNALEIAAMMYKLFTYASAQCARNDMHQNWLHPASRCIRDYSSERMQEMQESFCTITSGESLFQLADSFDAEDSQSSDCVCMHGCGFSSRCIVASNSSCPDKHRRATMSFKQYSRIACSNYKKSKRRSAAGLRASLCTICYTGFLEQAGTIASFFKTTWDTDIKDDVKRKQARDALVTKLEAAGINVTNVSKQLHDESGLDANFPQSEIFRALLRYEHLMGLDKKCQDYVSGLRFGKLSEMTGEDGLNRAYMRYMAANRDGLGQLLRKLHDPIRKSLRQEGVRLQRIGVLIKRSAHKVGKGAKKSVSVVTRPLQEGLRKRSLSLKKKKSASMTKTKVVASEVNRSDGGPAEQNALLHYLASLFRRSNESNTTVPDQCEALEQNLALQAATEAGGSTRKPLASHNDKTSEQSLFSTSTTTSLSTTSISMIASELELETLAEADGVYDASFFLSERNREEVINYSLAFSTTTSSAVDTAGDSVALGSKRLHSLAFSATASAPSDTVGDSSAPSSKRLRGDIADRSDALSTTTPFAATEASTGENVDSSSREKQKRAHQAIASKAHADALSERRRRSVLRHSWGSFQSVMESMANYGLDTAQGLWFIYWDKYASFDFLRKFGRTAYTGFSKFLAWTDLISIFIWLAYDLAHSGFNFYACSKISKFVESMDALQFQFKDALDAGVACNSKLHNHDYFRNEFKLYLRATKALQRMRGVKPDHLISLDGRSDKLLTSHKLVTQEFARELQNHRLCRSRRYVIHLKSFNWKSLGVSNVLMDKIREACCRCEILFNESIRPMEASGAIRHCVTQDEATTHGR